MTTVALRAPTRIADTVTDETGNQWISWDGSNWIHLRVNQDNPQLSAGDSGPSDGLTAAQRAELIALGNVPDSEYTQPAELPMGVAAVLRYIQSGVRAYRLIGTDGRSTYTLTQP